MVARELQTVAYALDGKVAKLINAKLGSDVVELVSYSLRDVAVLEIPLDRNGEIAARLTGRELCRNAVRDLLESGELVCQGQSVLLATLEYELTEKSADRHRGKLKGEDAPVVKQAIEAIRCARGRRPGPLHLRHRALLRREDEPRLHDAQGRQRGALSAESGEAATPAASMPLISGT